MTLVNIELNWIEFFTDMSWQKHIGKITKANRMFGLLLQNLRNCPLEYCELTSVLEYCSAAQSGALTVKKKDTTKVENIQRQAARFVLQRYQRRNSVTSMLQELEWKSLEWAWPCCTKSNTSWLPSIHLTTLHQWSQGFSHRGRLKIFGPRRSPTGTKSGGGGGICEKIQLKPKLPT